MSFFLEQMALMSICKRVYSKTTKTEVLEDATFILHIYDLTGFVLRLAKQAFRHSFLEAIPIFFNRFKTD